MRQSTSKVKTGQLWSKSKADLAKQLGELKTELGQLRTQKIAGGSASKLTKMCVVPSVQDPSILVRDFRTQSRAATSRKYG
jgi:ribosomal protein L29